jgi:peptidoglycan/xylan/chitin deacetylase (PgdA/CDA1 family)
VIYGRTFKRHLQYLKSNYINIPLEQVVAARESGRALPKNGITITFDDGYLNNHDCAVPLLLEHGFSATFFVNPKHVEMAEQGKKMVMWWDVIDFEMDSRNYLGFASIFERHGIKIARKDNYEGAKVEMEEALKDMAVETSNKITSEIGERYALKEKKNEYPAFMDWRQLLKLKAWGMGIGAHTMSHVAASQLPPERFHDEFVRSKEVLEEKLNGKADFFAFPYGGAKHYSKAALAAVKGAGYRCALLVLSGKDKSEADPFCLNRTSIHKSDDLRTFKIKAAGIYDDLKILYGKVRGLWKIRN